MLAALAVSLGAALLEVTPKQWQHAIDPEADGAIDYAAIERRLTTFVHGQVAEQLAAIKRGDRNHAIDAVAIGLFAALRRTEATVIAPGVRLVPGDDHRMLVLRDALIEGRVADANQLIAEIAAAQGGRA